MSEYILRGLSHIGLRSHKPQESCDFYINNFGFQMYYRHLINGLDCWFIERGGLVLEFVDDGKVHEDGDGMIYHIALEVCGIEGLVEELKAKGVLPEDAEIATHTDFFPSGKKNLFFRGPMGEMIELFELAS